MNKEKLKKKRPKERIIYSGRRDNKYSIRSTIDVKYFFFHQKKS
jgi:hypothetical protein